MVIIDEEIYLEKLSFNWFSIVFLVIFLGVVDVWVFFKGKDIYYSKKEFDGVIIFELLMVDMCWNIDFQYFQDFLLLCNFYKMRLDNFLVLLYNSVIGLIVDLV